MITLSANFSSFTGGLLSILAFVLPRSPIPAPLATLLVKRVLRMRNQFVALIAHFRAGTLPPPPAPRPSRAGAPRPDSAPRLAMLAPRKVAALLHPIPESSWLCRCFLMNIIENDPLEAQALVAAAPQAARTLRTVCRMVGLKVPPWLALPRRKRVRKPRQPAPRKPRDPAKLGRIAYANLIAPECADGPSGSRPPNRIGYGRSRGFPRDYRPNSKND